MGAAGYLINNREEYNPKINKDICTILDDFSKSYLYHKSLQNYVQTPILELPTLSHQIGVKSILVKDEGLRFGTSALKILGATYAIHEALIVKQRTNGVCTATDGNHGRAVAWAARQKGLNAVIFVPGYTTKSRINYIEIEGAEVVVCQGDYDFAVKEAVIYSKENDFLLIQDTSWDEYMHIPALITAGYYTQVHEVFEQTQNLSNPKIDIIFLQAGVGSWPSAVVHFIRKFKQNNNVKIVCVEPFESDAIYESIKVKSLATTSKSQKTIMAGLNCGTPSALAFEILKAGADVFLTIADQYTIDAIKYLNAPLPGDTYIASGESGAAGLAGLLAIINNHILKDLRTYLKIDKNSNILVFNTENVTDPELFKILITEKHKLNLNE